MKHKKRNKKDNYYVIKWKNYVYITIITYPYASITVFWVYNWKTCKIFLTNNVKWTFIKKIIISIKNSNKEDWTYIYKNSFSTWCTHGGDLTKFRCACKGS